MPCSAASVGLKFPAGTHSAQSAGVPLLRLHRTRGHRNGGAPKVSRSRTILLLLSLILVTWVGSAGITYGVVELTGGGPQGEQGEQGPRGARGTSGLAGLSGTDSGTSAGLQRLAAMWAVNVTAQHNPGESIRGTDPRVKACIDYITNGTGSFVECGFTR